LAIAVCPTDVVLASADRVWDLLTIPGQFEPWSGAKVLKAPPHRLAEGDDLVLGDGPLHRFQVKLHIIRAERPEELALEIRLPFGVVNHEVVRITAAAPDRCRVTFN
jgi:uncharacterized protein YndB with AHSA1/START domain